MSTLSGGPNVIMNGLVLYLDAANPKSYISGSTTWNDVSRSGNNGTLVNGPTFNSANGGSIVFDGTNDYVSTTYTTALTDFTAGAWFFANSTGNPSTRILDKNFTNGFWIGKSTSGAANSWGGGVFEPSFPHGRFITLTDNQWHYIVSRRQGTTHTILGDGISNTISGTVPSTSLSTNILVLGREYDIGPSIFKGNISIVHIYNRALSDQEILQNFNATRARFGI
jgi:hypothetical protein